MKHMTLSKIGNLIIFHRDNPDNDEIRRRVEFALKNPCAVRRAVEPGEFIYVEITKSDRIDEVWMKVLSAFDGG
ncbi:MAG: hypothetical protein FJ088_03500 [Deltaproteobacteria bacterium]|nr:hypothetical protein [Deltaproteobacteria bacterium]